MQSGRIVDPKEHRIQGEVRVARPSPSRNIEDFWPKELLDRHRERLKEIELLFKSRRNVD